MRLLLALLLWFPLAGWAQAVVPWDLEPSETTADLRGVHAVGGGVVWASGTNGTVLRSQDSGFEWQSCAVPPGAEKLDFRAVWAWDDQTAVVMSSGPGALSRLYKTTDGCAHWILLYTNPDKDGFWDALVFRTDDAAKAKEGIIVGDPVQGRFSLFATGDGGSTWRRWGHPMSFKQQRCAERVPKAAEGESLFAASNEAALVSQTIPSGFAIGSSVLFVTGGVRGSRFFASTYTDFDFAMPCWTDFKTTGIVPLGTQSSGMFALAGEPGQYGLNLRLVAVGGDYMRPDERRNTAYFITPKQGSAIFEGDVQVHQSAMPPGGYRSAVGWDAELKLWVTVGPNGSDISRDDGRTWQPLEHAPADAPKGGEWNALSLPWAVGPHGRIGKLNPEALRK